MGAQALSTAISSMPKYHKLEDSDIKLMYDAIIVLARNKQTLLDVANKDGVDYFRFILDIKRESSPVIITYILDSTFNCKVSLQYKSSMRKDMQYQYLTRAFSFCPEVDIEQVRLGRSLGWQCDAEVNIKKYDVVDKFDKAVKTYIGQVVN